jgi:hypothetical protein
MTPQAAPLPPAQRFTASSGAVSILEIVIDEGAAILIEINYAQENVESSVPARRSENPLEPTDADRGVWGVTGWWRRDVGGAVGWC